MCKHAEALSHTAATAEDLYNAHLKDAAEALRAALELSSNVEVAGPGSRAVSKDLTFRACEMIEALPRLVGSQRGANPRAIWPDDLDGPDDKDKKN